MTICKGIGAGCCWHGTTRSSMADEDSLELMQRVQSLRLTECEANPSGVDGSKAKRVRGWVSIALTDADGHHLLKQIARAYGASCKLDIAKTPMTASSGKAMATVEKGRRYFPAMQSLSGMIGRPAVSMAGGIIW